MKTKIPPPMNRDRSEGIPYHEATTPWRENDKCSFNTVSCGRGSDSDFARFLQITMGSASETEYLLLFCKDLQMIIENDHKLLHENIVEIKKLFVALLKKLKAER